MGRIRLMRRTTASCLALLLLCLEPFSGSGRVVKTSDIQRLDLLTFPWSPQPLPTVFLGKLVLESSGSNGGEVDAGLANITPSAPRPRIVTPESTRGDESFGSQLSIEEFCLTLAAAAEASNIPIAFFARLIWQESEFRPNETSPAGAQGVAQFMPRTASEVGLDNPFDPLKALPASARFLRRLRDEFGNLGLAAAAYNAGSGRVRDWLARREALPAETQTYVRKITGSPAESWATQSKTLKMAQQLPARASCEGTEGLSRNQLDVAVSVSLAPAISGIIQRAKREAEAARASTKAAAAANEKSRSTSIKLKMRNIASIKSSGSSLRTANAKRPRATKIASASSR
jgi:hypothetical protein